MAEATSFRGMDDTMIREITEDFCRIREGLAHQVFGVDEKVKELGIELDKMDVKFEELKQLMMGFQNQMSTVVNLESDATLKEDIKLKSTCMEEVNHS